MVTLLHQPIASESLDSQAIPGYTDVQSLGACAIESVRTLLFAGMIGMLT